MTKGTAALLYDKNKNKCPNWAGIIVKIFYAAFLCAAIPCSSLPILRS
ncbi:hypothetical protein IFT69_16210 [Pseudomonas putida]|nr:hypothetical protein [Pseudomonas putida]